MVKSFQILYYSSDQRTASVRLIFALTLCPDSHVRLCSHNGMRASDICIMPTVGGEMTIIEGVGTPDTFFIA